MAKRLFETLLGKVGSIAKKPTPPMAKQPPLVGGTTAAFKPSLKPVMPPIAKQPPNIGTGISSRLPQSKPTLLPPKTPIAKQPIIGAGGGSTAVKLPKATVASSPIQDYYRRRTGRA